MISISRIAGLVAAVASGAAACRQLTDQSETAGDTDAETPSANQFTNNIIDVMNCYYSPTQDRTVFNYPTILMGDNPHVAADAADHERAYREFLSSYPHGIPLDFKNYAYHIEAARIFTLEDSCGNGVGYYDFLVGSGVFYDTVNQECLEELPLE